MAPRSFATHSITFHDDDGNHSFTTAVLLDPRVIPSLPSSLPSCSVLTPAPPVYEIRDAGPDRGFGMFATCDIVAGSLILVEHPAIVTPAALPATSDPQERICLYHALSERLLPRDRNELLTMANCCSSKQCPTVEEGVAWTNGTSISLPLPSSAECDEASDSDPRTKEYGATFLQICRSNHSCSPNAAVKWSLPTFSSSLYALRPIFRGEEITIIYTDVTQPQHIRRNVLSSHYGFLCLCSACSLPPSSIPASDGARAALRDWRHTRPSYRGWWDDMCREDNAIINPLMEALELVEKEGLHSMQAIFVEELCLCWAVLGEEREFRKWAEKLVQLSQVQDPELAREARGWLEDPERQAKRWGWRKKERLQMVKRREKAPPSPEIYCSPLLFPSDDQ